MVLNVVTDSSGNTFALRSIVCPICGPSPSKLVGHRGGSGHRHGLGVRGTVVRCAGCGLLFANPFPFPVDPQVLYGDPEKYFASPDVDAKVASNRQIIAELVADSGVDRPSLLARQGIKDNVLAFGALQLHKLGNLTGLSINMDAWARKV